MAGRSLYEKTEKEEKEKKKEEEEEMKMRGRKGQGKGEGRRRRRRRKQISRARVLRGRAVLTRYSISYSKSQRVLYREHWSSSSY